jgi:hypothetical protein
MKKPWTESPACQEHQQQEYRTCLFCRTVGKWQDHMGSGDFQNPRDAVCPEGFKLWETPLPLTLAMQKASGATVGDTLRTALQKSPSPRPPVTAGKVATFLEAMLLAPRVSAEVEAQRLAICEKCDKRKMDKDGTPFCSMCGCSVAKDGWKFLHLTHYEENLPKWGCKHPFRNHKHKITNQEYGWPLPVQGEPK